MGTTNLQLIDLAKDLPISNFHCICKDETNQYPTNNIPINIIVYLIYFDNNVSGYWCLCFINDDQKVYYSSLWNLIPNQEKEFMMKVDNRKLLSSNFQIQDFNTDTCKLYCIIILFLLNNKIKYKDIIIDFL